MFTKFKKSSPFDYEIDRCMTELERYTIGSDQYDTVLEEVSKLKKMREEDSRRISPDTLAIVGANLLGIVLVIQHENVNVITSKAMSLVTKPRTT